ncbi:hypothetical protein RclHR1_01500005 [Rhizophagus clarus]|nr:hypothetical protein RclHR1_01500005 [Rhizophagus clarus]
MPYVWVCAIVKSFSDLRMIYWKYMLKYDEPMNWKIFEDFNTKFWALRLSLFRLIEYEKINLKTLFKVPETYKNNQVKYADMTEIRNGYVDLDLLKNDNIKSYIGCLFLNMPGALWNAFGFLNKSSESASKICIAQRSKSTTTSEVAINQDLLDKVHKKVTEAMNVEKKDWVLLFLTNADKKNNLSIDDKPNSALVSRENFQKFYGYTYASRAQFASINKTIYFNNAPAESLIIFGFNEDERINIRRKRKERPFNNLDDIKKRLNIDDERFKKLRLDRISFI